MYSIEFDNKEYLVGIEIDENKSNLRECLTEEL